MNFLNIAFYRFVSLGTHGRPALAVLKLDLLERCRSLEIRGTILLAPEGVNGSLSGSHASIRAFQEWLKEHKEFAGLEYKESESESIAFRRMKVKLKREIIPLGMPEIRPAELTGERLKPQALKKWLDERRDVVLLDTRNRFEIEAGTFEGAMDMGLASFREFPERLKELQNQLSGKDVVMFCTGGIRCEKATAVALRLGLRNVYQLEGGILKYFEECGSSHYLGDCFVFDERVALNEELRQSGKAT